MRRRNLLLHCLAVSGRPTLLLLGLAAATLAGCGGSEDAGPAARRFLSIGTAPPGGAFFVVGGALAEVLDQRGASGPMAGWRVTAEATKGTQENLRRLASGELDFALANAAITYFAVRGEGGWEAPQPIEAVMTLAPNVALFLAREGSGIRRIADLAGRRVVIGPAGAGFEYFVEPILEAHGVGLEDLVALNATQAGAVEMLADGSAVAAFLGGAVPTASITQAAAGGGVSFVPFDEEALVRLAADYPFFERATIPAGTYRGQDVDFQGLNVGSMHLVTAAGRDDELVYQVTRALWEGREQVVEKHPAGRFIRAEVVVRDIGTPFHPGAERLYRELGIWPASP